MKKQFAFFVLVLIAALAVTSCGGARPAPPAATTSPPAATTAPAKARTLTLITHDSFAASEEVIAQFEGENNAILEILEIGGRRRGPQPGHPQQRQPLGRRLLRRG